MRYGILIATVTQGQRSGEHGLIIGFQSLSLHNGNLLLVQGAPAVLPQLYLFPGIYPTFITGKSACSGYPLLAMSHRRM
jgi:hypothetical protein